jgi:hypothetical protein
MSLLIDVDKVGAVLLADGWHEVADKSFNFDSYEFACRGETIHYGGESDVCGTGFSFREGDGMLGWSVTGPLTAILAVKSFA